MDYKVEITGVIEVDANGNAHCGEVLFAPIISKYKGCQCTISRYWDNEMDYGTEYPFFVGCPERIDYSLTGIVEEAEGGKLHVRKYALPYQNPPQVSKGATIVIKQIHPIVRKGTEYYGIITEYSQYGVESKDDIDSAVCFLIDTNALMDNSSIFDHIDEERPAIIVSHVITELDGLKKSTDEKTHQAAQKANCQILEASKQGKVVFVATKFPYEPFEAPYTMDQKILSAAFLEQFRDTTVILISSDRNMLLLAESNGVQGITLEDFLYGNYTIETKEPKRKSNPEPQSEPALEYEQVVFDLGAVDKPSRYRENLEKDLERKYDEYSRLIEQLGRSLYGDLMVEDEKGSPLLKEFQGKIRCYQFATPLSILIIYDWFFHGMLFTEWNWKKDREVMEQQGISYRDHTAEEIFNALSRINYDAVCLLFDNINCPLGVKKTLKGSMFNKQKDVFVETLDQLTCDLSILHFYSDYFSIFLGMIIGAYSNPQAVYDFIFHCDYGKLTESLKEVLLPFVKEDLELQINSEVSSAPLKKHLEDIDSSIVTVLEATCYFTNELINKYHCFPFEKKYIDLLYTNPSLQSYWDKVKAIVDDQERKGNETPTGNPQGQDDQTIVNYKVPDDIFNPQKRVVDDTIYVHSLHPDVTDKQNSVELFQKLFNYVLKWGFINDNADQGAMLTLLTGYAIQGSSGTAKWCCDKYMPRVLYYIVKYISKSSSKYDSLESVSFYSDDKKTQNRIESDLYSIRQGSNISQIVNNSIPVEIKRTLYNLYPSLFPEPIEE